MKKSRTDASVIFPGRPQIVLRGGYQAICILNWDEGFELPFAFRSTQKGVFLSRNQTGEMTGMRTSTLYFYVSFSHTTHQGRPCERNQREEEKNKTRWLGFPKKLAEEAIRLYNGKRRRKLEGGELLGKIKGGGTRETQEERSGSLC